MIVDEDTRRGAVRLGTHGIDKPGRPSSNAEVRKAAVVSHFELAANAARSDDFRTAIQQGATAMRLLGESL